MATDIGIEGFHGRIERLEDETLSPRAARSYPARAGASGARLARHRTPFQRDRDRIVHSKAFRRLKHKTQVFIAPEGDHYRTRLTHTLEASGIARNVARALALNEDLTEAISLGHDLGHPPFGHIGEAVLDECVQRALRRPASGTTGTRCAWSTPELDGRGLNLTEQVRDGILRHTGPEPPATLEGRDREGGRPHRVHQPRHRRRPPRGGAPSEDLPAAEIAVLGETGSERIETLVRDLLERSRERRRHRAGGGSRRRDAQSARRSCSSALPGSVAQRENAPDRAHAPCACSTYYAEHPPPRSPTTRRAPACDGLAGRHDRSLRRSGTFSELSVPQGL